MCVCVCMPVRVSSYMVFSVGIGESAHPILVLPHCHPKHSGQGQSCHYQEDEQAVAQLFKQAVTLEGGGVEGVEGGGVEGVEGEGWREWRDGGGVEGVEGGGDGGSGGMEGVEGGGDGGRRGGGGKGMEGGGWREDGVEGVEGMEGRG